MEDQFWYALIGELSGPISLDGDEELMIRLADEHYIQVERYPALIRELYSRFIGEWRRNMRLPEFDPDYLKDQLGKLENFFRADFGIDLPEGNLSYPIYYKQERQIPRSGNNENPYLIVLRARIEVYCSASSFLQKEIKKRSRQRSSRERATAEDFRFKNTPDAVRLFDYGVRRRFFLSDNSNDFANIFEGRAADNKIDWQGTIYKLKCFINGINGFTIEKITDGKWGVVAQLFNANGHEITASQLDSAHKGRNEAMLDVNGLIEYFNHHS